MEGTLGLAAGFAQRPQPGHIEVGMSRSMDDGIQGRSSFFEARFQSGGGGFHASVESFADGITRIERQEGVIERIEQAVTSRIILVEVLSRFQCHPHQADKVARRLVDLHYLALAHV